MNCLRRSGLAAARRTRFQPRAQQPRRLAHDSHGAHDAHHGHHHAEPVNESFGTGFYVAIGSVPVGLLLYNYMQGGNGSWFTKVIQLYQERNETWAARNDLHVKMVEQAGRDKALFGAAPAEPYIELMYPEQFHASAPWNVPAGQGSINLDKVIAHYEKKNFKEQEEKLKALKEGTLKAEQPVGYQVK